MNNSIISKSNSGRNIFLPAKGMLMIIVLLGSLLIHRSAMAQQQNLTILNYSMGLGLDNTGDFISKYSFRGFGFSYRHLSQSHIGAGIDMGWNTFYQELDNASYTYETATITGDQWRYFNTFPILAAVDFYKSPGEKINPYGGLGVGVEYNIATVNFGVYSAEKDAWPFTISPEIGVLIQSPSGPAFNVGIKYIYGFKTQDLSSDMHLQFNVGFAFGE